MAIIHIPLSLYAHFVQPILQILALTGHVDPGYDGVRRPWQFYYPFANISLTSIECSIVCTRHLVQELFQPVLANLDTKLQGQVSISQDDFVVIQIGGGGMEAGQRVLDLTAPLALAGMYVFSALSYGSSS